MTSPSRLRIAVQKSGRLAEKTMGLLAKSGVDFDLRKDRLLQPSTNFPMDLMLVRDDDIPEYVADGVCDLGIVGQNVIEEKCARDPSANFESLDVLLKLGFGRCRLSIAVPKEFTGSYPQDFQGLRIATTYPDCLRRYLKQAGITAKIVELSGSVEIAPTLKIADAICDLVSTGGTLESNGLREISTVFESEACLVRTKKLFNEDKQTSLDRLLRRMTGVMKASCSKYIMMNTPRSALARIREILPGMEEPSVMPLGNDGERVAVHAVAPEDVFWETIESLKEAGASSILVLPIEKVIA